MTGNELKIRFKVVIPPEWDNRQKGKFWEEISAPLFRRHRWKVIENIEFQGMQTDIYVKHLDTGKRGLIECKFEKSPIEAPAIYKLMGQADSEEVKYAYLLSTSDLNPKARGIVEKYHNKQYDLVIWSSNILAKVFMDIYDINLPEINESYANRVEAITLLITHKKDFFWVAEKIGDDGYPSHAIIFPIPKRSVNSENWQEYFSRYKIFSETLEITVFNQTVIEPEDKSTNQLSSEIEKVTVSKINQADSFDDYHRPSRPENFFGRAETQNEFWDFLKNVRDKKTDLRVVCFRGSTGVGKSSLVLKLASDCRQKQEYKNNFIYHVDVTSSYLEKETLYVIAVIRKALQEAIDTGFIDIPNHQVFIESSEPPYFDSKSIKLVRQKLQEADRVILIFFDQFEEILTKNSLSSIYEMFEKIAYEVDSLKENLVLGFCWRTDVNLPTTNPAYFTWHNLTKVRKDIYFNEFSKQDSSSLLDGFEKYLNEKHKRKRKRLQKSIRDWLLENCQNQPWLLKRFCGDIYNQHLNGADVYSAEKKVITKFDIKTIFDKDIETATDIPGSYKCLEHIAKLSPVDKMDVCSQFNRDVINSLLKSKLVIENGSNYKIYWDMFREYLVEKKLPEMTISYRFRTNISTVLKIFRLLNQYETISDLVPVSGYKQKTVENALQALQNFFEVKK
jgi:DNA polymerase III delta prime subunit